MSKKTKGSLYKSNGMRNVKKTESINWVIPLLFMIIILLVLSLLQLGLKYHQEKDKVDLLCEQTNSLIDLNNMFIKDINLLIGQHDLPYRQITTKVQNIDCGKW